MLIQYLETPNLKDEYEGCWHIQLGTFVLLLLNISWYVGFNDW